MAAEYKPHHAPETCKGFFRNPKVYPFQSLVVAVDLLQFAPSSRQIAGLAKEKKVPLAYGDSRLSYIGGRFENGVIVLSREMALADPLDQAVAISHELWHARQKIELAMVDCLELEQEAYFIQNAVYHELTQAGLPRLPETNPTEQAYRLFVNRTLTGGDGAGALALLEVSRQTDAALDLMAAGAPQRLRPLYRMFLEYAEAGRLAIWKPLEARRLLPYRLFGEATTEQLDLTARFHAEELQRQDSWLRKNRAQLMDVLKTIRH